MHKDSLPLFSDLHIKIQFSRSISSSKQTLFVSYKSLYSMHLKLINLHQPYHNLTKAIIKTFPRKKKLPRIIKTKFTSELQSKSKK